MKAGELASKIARIEGHKSQSRIGDIREIIGVIADLSYAAPDAIQCIVQLGIARAKRKRPKADPA